MDLVERIGWYLGLSGLGAILAATACQVTGTSALTSSGASVNTHTPATWVIGTIGVILVVNSLGLLGYAKEHRTPTPDTR
jgi:amino acid transporter